MKHVKESIQSVMHVVRSSMSVHLARTVTCLLCIWISSATDSKGNGSCNVTIRSSTQSSKNGTFHSPNWPNTYAGNLRCVYNFIGLPHERVSVRFLDFSVKGSPPRCSNDYVDVYTQVRVPSQDLLEVPLHGRYCGSDVEQLPRLFISMHHVFVVGFYTDQHKDDRGFSAEYSFIDGSVYNVGTPATSPSVCGQTIFGDRRPVGDLLSPTYPGTYPDNLFCFYRLQGVPGQRIRLTFINIDLYSGGDHCPYDFVRVYDGSSNASEPIGTYCGRWHDAVVYSSTESLYVEFVTKSGRAEPTRRPSHHQSASSSSSSSLAELGLSSLKQPGRGRDSSGGARGGPSFLGGTRADSVGGGDVQRSGFKARFEITGSFVNLGWP